MQMASSVSTRLQYQHKSLIDIIDGLSDEQVRTKVHTGKWSIFENIVHLQTYQHTAINRIRTLLEDGTPTFEIYSAEADPLFGENCVKSTREVIQDLLTTRKEMAASILNLQDEDLKKAAIHPKFGKLDLIGWLNFFLLHEAHHLYVIFQLTASLKNSQ